MTRIHRKHLKTAWGWGAGPGSAMHELAVRGLPRDQDEADRAVLEVEACVRYVERGPRDRRALADLEGLKAAILSCPCPPRPDPVPSCVAVERCDVTTPSGIAFTAELQRVNPAPRGCSGLQWVWVDPSGRPHAIAVPLGGNQRAALRSRLARMGVRRAELRFR